MQKPLEDFGLRWIPDFGEYVGSCWVQFQVRSSCILMLLARICGCVCKVSCACPPDVAGVSYSRIILMPLNIGNIGDERFSLQIWRCSHRRPCPVR